MKTRYRIQTRLFGKPTLVLQVGIEREKGQYVGFNGDTLAPPSWHENEVVTSWRDAIVEDLQLLDNNKLTKG